MKAPPLLAHVRASGFKHGERRRADGVCGEREHRANASKHLSVRDARTPLGAGGFSRSGAGTQLPAGTRIAAINSPRVQKGEIAFLSLQNFNDPAGDLPSRCKSLAGADQLKPPGPLRLCGSARAISSIHEAGAGGSSREAAKTQSFLPVHASQPTTRRVLQKGRSPSDLFKISKTPAGDLPSRCASHAGAARLKPTGSALSVPQCAPCYSLRNPKSELEKPNSKALNAERDERSARLFHLTGDS